MIKVNCEYKTKEDIGSRFFYAKFAADRRSSAS